MIAYGPQCSGPRPLFNAKGTGPSKMTYGRRTIDRRRRVLYTAHHTDPPHSGAARRRTAQRLREAKRPTAAYGARVHRRLQGRWFSLVPVRRRTLIGVASALLLLVLMLAAAHYAAVAWPAIATHPQIARPLRLDRPDSFGRWIHSLLLAASAGASLLIYQLRRYRLDDYLGHYRIWRVVLLVTLGASVNSAASLVDWTGAVLDAVFGRRVALTGGDWISLVLSIGGAVLALRITAEVRRSRWALATMIAAWALFAIAPAAAWNFLAVDGLGSWMLVTSAPLLASAMLLISLGGYLRHLYREVREIEESEPVLQRVRQLGLRLIRPDREEESRDAESPRSPETTAPPAAESRPPRRWWRRKAPAETHSPPAPSARRRRKAERPQSSDQDVEAGPEAAAEENGEDKRPARRWFGLRRAKPDPPPDPSSKDDSVGDSKAESAAKADRPQESSQPQKAAEKRRRFFPKRPFFAKRPKPDREAEPGPEDTEPGPGDTGPADGAADASEQSPQGEGEAKRPRFALAALRPGRWLRRRSSKAASSETASGDEEPAEQSRSQQRKPPPAPAASPEEDDDSLIDPEDIDWSSLSKTQRRRLKKQLRRQGRAA